MKKNILFVIFLNTVLLLANTVFAEEKKPKNLEGIEFLSGFSSGELREKEDYQLIPLAIGFDFNLKPLLQKINFNPSQLLQFQLEPFISLVSQPSANIETGTSFLLKIGLLPQTWKFQPYIKGGVGMVYMTQHTLEQGSQFNFTEQVGAGMHYFFRKNMAFTLEYRLRHLSNASIKRPNKGINTYLIAAGLAYQF